MMNEGLLFLSWSLYLSVNVSIFPSHLLQSYTGWKKTQVYPTNKREKTKFIQPHKSNPSPTGDPEEGEQPPSTIRFAVVGVLTFFGILPYKFCNNSPPNLCWWGSLIIGRHRSTRGSVFLNFILPQVDYFLSERRTFGKSWLSVQALADHYAILTMEDVFISLRWDRVWSRQRADLPVIPIKKKKKDLFFQMWHLVQTRRCSEVVIPSFGPKRKPRKIILYDSIIFLKWCPIKFYIYIIVI